MTAFDSSSLKFWESVAEWGFRMVFIGVAGEGAEIIAKLYFKKSFKKYEHSWDIFSGICWLILVVGLAIEFKGTHNVTRLSDSENARLTDESAIARREAGQANERAANTESNNLVLSIELEKLKHPRIVTPEQRKRFIELLSEAHNVSKTRIEVITGNTDRETERFAFQVRKVLDEAGYGGFPSKYQSSLVHIPDNSIYVTNVLPNIDLPAFEWDGAILMKIPNLIVPPLPASSSPIYTLTKNIMDANGDFTSENAFTDKEPEIIALFYGSAPPTNTMPSVGVEYSTPNNPNRGSLYTFAPTKDTNAILYGVCAAFHDAGVTVGVATMKGFLAPGRVAFFIPSQ